MAKEHPYITLIESLVNIEGWTYAGPVDPPTAPAGHILETKRDSFLGYVTHYRFVPEVKS